MSKQWNPVEWAQPVKEGKLTKRGHVVRNWKTRRFVLQGKKLFYFKSNAPNPQGVIDLVNCDVTTSGKKAHCMLITDGNDGKPYLICATSDNEMSEWMHAIRDASRADVCSEPMFVKHKVHVNFDEKAGGFVGLPKEWEVLLMSSGITDDEVKANPNQVLGVLKFEEKRLKDMAAEQARPKDQQETKHVLPENEVLPSLPELCDAEDPESLYVDLKKIGQGAFGEVYVATHAPTNKMVAIKKMEVTPKNEIHLITEVYYQKTCQHKNIVALVGNYLQHDILWVVMEFLECGALTGLLEMYPTTQMHEPEIAYVLRETLEALNYMHTMHRLHRDIKSDNVLLGADGCVKLADFGFTAQLTEEQTQRNTVIGTPFWMAPELIQGEPYGEKVDVWSTGVLLIEMCEGEPPYMDLPTARALFLISTQPMPPLKDEEQWSPELRDFLAKCLTRNVEERASVAELLTHPFLEKSSEATGLVNFLRRMNKQTGEQCTIA